MEDADVALIWNRARLAGIRVLGETPDGRLRLSVPSTPQARAVFAAMQRRRDQVRRGVALGYHRERPWDAATTACGPVVEEALRLGARPACKMTVRESADVEADREWLSRVARTIEESPGDDWLLMRIVTLDGRRVRLGWRCGVTRELRGRLATLLAERASRRGSLAHG